MDFKIIKILSTNNISTTPNIIYWYSNNTTLKCPYNQITCDLTVDMFSGDASNKSSPPVTPYFNYECTNGKFNSQCSKYTGTIQITQAGYYNLYYDINGPAPLQGYDIKIIIYSGLFVYDIGNPPSNNQATLRAFYLNTGDTLKFTIKNTLVGVQQGTIQINRTT